MDNEEIISKLKFLSKVQKCEKINVNGLFVQLDGLKTTVSRTIWNPDSRQNTLTFIESTINKSCTLIDLYLRSEKSSEVQMGKNILKDLNDSKVGIANLKHTYSDDVMFCSKIDTFLQIIDAKIIELQGKYYILFQDEDDDDNASGNSNETVVTRLDNSE